MVRQILITFLLMSLAAFANVQDTVPKMNGAENPEKVESKAISPFDRLGHNMVFAAFGWPLAFHVAGGSSTYFLSTNDVDLKVARFAARQDEFSFGLAFTPGMIAGTFFPVIVPGYMMFFSDNPAMNNTGAVSAQATAVAFLYNNILKAISGRAHPDAENNTGELSRDFKWGFFRRGVFYGWPSGHSMTNASLAMSIASYHRENPYVVVGCGLYAGYIATSMVLGAKGEAHWFSDAVAGVLMGASIGWYIGNTFYQEKSGHKTLANNRPATEPGFIIAPILYEDRKGGVVLMKF